MKVYDYKKAIHRYPIEVFINSVRVGHISVLRSIKNYIRLGHVFGWRFKINSLITKTRFYIKNLRSGLQMDLRPIELKRWECVEVRQGYRYLCEK